MVVDKTGTVAIEKLKDNAVGFEVLIRWHLSAVEHVICWTRMAKQTIFVVHLYLVAILLCISVAMIFFLLPGGL